MPVPVSRLRVHPNPYIKETIDHLGRPAGRVKCGHFEHAKTGLVGAKFVEVVETHAAQSFKVGKLSYVTAPARHDHRIAYSRVPVEIPNTGYYRDAIKRGDLFAADRKTWVASGGAAIPFVEPAVALAKAKKEALDHLQEQVQAMQQAVQAQEYEVGRQTDWLVGHRRDLEAAQAARQVVEESETGYQLVLSARTKLETLDEEKRKKVDLERQKDTAQHAMIHIQSVISRLDKERQQAIEDGDAAAALAPQVERQDELDLRTVRVLQLVHEHVSITTGELSPDARA